MGVNGRRGVWLEGLVPVVGLRLVLQPDLLLAVRSGPGPAAK